ncbi:MAG: CoA transferase [Gemmatimonadaceae bacterium]|nr:CoA transferase [Gemmatimonadaceae bacterium]
MTASPLSGVKVLDLSRVLAGPLCTMTLGDLGADVIKVERPEGGDETRGWGPPFDARGGSAYFLSINRNKRSLTADLKSARDREFVTQLILEADVVVENFLPAVLSRNGLDSDVLLTENSRLIWCSIRGYPTDLSRPGYDFAMQAEAGWMSVTGEPDGVPVRTAVALIDVLTGKDAAIAVLAALLGRRTGSAADRTVTITLGGSAVAALANVAQNALVSGNEAGRWGNAHANLVPYQLFETADRPMVVAVGSDAQWRALTGVLASETLAADERLRANAGRVVHREACVTAVQEILRTRPAAEWQIRCQSAGVPVGMLRTVREALATTDASPLTGVPSSVGGAVFRPPPLLGEHSAEIRRYGWGTPRAT